jgi:hypothetical protein
VNSGWPAVLQTAFGAILASGIGGIVALVVSKKQQKEQRRIERILRRNKWVDELRQCIQEVLSPATWFHRTTWKSRPSQQGDGTFWDSEMANTIKLTGSITRICLMLDPEVEAHAERIKALELVRSASFASDIRDVAQFENAHKSLMMNARVVLKSMSAEADIW